MSCSNTYLNLDEIWVRDKNGTDYVHQPGVVCTADTDAGASYKPALFCDGSNTTYYASARQKIRSAWLLVDLGQDIPMSSIQDVWINNKRATSFLADAKCFMLSWLDANNVTLQQNYFWTQKGDYVFQAGVGDTSPPSPGARCASSRMACTDILKRRRPAAVASSTSGAARGV